MKWLFLLFPLAVWAIPIDTFYGTLEVDEPVLLELIASPPMQRLKEIHQYGVCYYNSEYCEEYTRYSHSLGVFALLRLKGASLEEQIAGLLHDVSHTVFSHVGDWIFSKVGEEKDYQNTIHRSFLLKYNIGAILEKYQISLDVIQPLEAVCPMLEKPCPNLCADRIEYNIQGAFHRGKISYAEALKIVDSLHYLDGNWVTTDPEAIKQIADFSLEMTVRCWGSPHNYVSSQCLAEALLRAIEIGELSWEDIHFGTDPQVWRVLESSSDGQIQAKLAQLRAVEETFRLVSSQEADLHIRLKFRGIDPLIWHEGRYQPLTKADPSYLANYSTIKELMEKGWFIKYAQ